MSVAPAAFRPRAVPVVAAAGVRRDDDVGVTAEHRHRLFCDFSPQAFNAADRGRGVKRGVVSQSLQDLQGFT